jgi:para-nitrobenzyl esterase
MKFLALISAFACTLSWGQVPAPVSSAPAGPTVSIHTGKIRGSLTRDGGAVFKGIPFAQPPTGNLRWREPVLAKPWTGVRDATAFGAPCVQGGALGQKSAKTASI